MFLLDAASALPAAPTPQPYDLDPNMVTPGVIGFGITFLLGVVIILIIIDMNRRVRRVRHRAEARERLLAEREQAASDETGATAAED